MDMVIVGGPGHSRRASSLADATADAKAKMEQPV